MRTEPLTATACLKQLRLNLSEDVSKKKPRRKNVTIPGAQSGLDDEVGAVAPKGLNSEKARLEEKRVTLHSEIQRKLDAREAIAADLSEKKKETNFVGTCIAEFRNELKSREVEVAENIQRKRTQFLKENTLVGEEMRAAQQLRQSQVITWSAIDNAELTRRNLESTKQQTQTLQALFETIAADKTAAGVRLREQRARNADAIKTVAAAELRRLQTVNEAVKHEQELSASRLKERLEHTQKQRTEEYVRNRTAQFNEFKKAAAVTENMQRETAAIIEQLRDKYDATRELERKLEKFSASA